METLSYFSRSRATIVGRKVEQKSRSKEREKEEPKDVHQRPPYR